MTEREQIEEQIREALASGSTAVALSDRLFGPAGLFGQLASTEEERRAVAQSPLFRQAQRIVSEIQQAEAEEFVRAIKQVKPAGPQASVG